jgi:hypothetical protein
MTWNSRAQDAVVEHIAEWLYQIERDSCKDDTYYQFGCTAIFRFRHDPIFRCKVLQLATRLNPVIDSVFMAAMLELRGCYEK